MQNKDILIEISNMCNGKCPYCSTGRGTHKKTGFMQPSLFKEILDKAFFYNIIDTKSTIHLYNWGEAFLHPELGAFLKILNKHSLHYGFSTNASIIPEIDKNFCKGLKRIIISMSGFSQESYDKIHQFNFEEIYENIAKIVTNIKKYTKSSEMIMAYHIYKFNEREISLARKFAQQLEITFSPRYALINDWFMANGYYRKTLPKTIRDYIEEDLFVSPFGAAIEKAAERKELCQYKNNPIVIDESGNVVLCCIIPNTEKNYSCGNILYTPWREIIKNKESNETCDCCLKHGISYGFNTHTSQEEEDACAG